MRDMIGIIKGVAKSWKEANRNLTSIMEEVLDASICQFAGLSKEQVQDRRMGNIFMTQLIHGHDNGWFDLKQQHLCNISAHKLKIQI